MLQLYDDVASEVGQLQPWRRGRLLEQPAKELEALHVIGAAWRDERERKRKERERLAKLRAMK